MSAAKTLSVALLLFVVASTAVDAKVFKGPAGDITSEMSALYTGGTALHDGNTHRGTMVLNANTTSTEIFAGQEARLVVSTSFLAHDPDTATLSRYWTRYHQFQNFTSPAFNISAGNVRVRVIAAYTGGRQTFSGATRSCKDSSADVWSETWQLSPRTLVFGKGIVVSGFATFTVPPFDFRVCVKDISAHNASTGGKTQSGENPDLGVNAGWKEFSNLGESTVYKFAEPAFYFQQSTTDNRAGDFTAITIVARGHNGKYDGYPFNPREFTTSDMVKLVPYGMPCTFEKPSSSTGYEANSGTGRNQYCGSNLLDSIGHFVSSATCQNEGSLGEGVATVGTNKQNPLSTSTTPTSYTLGPRDVLPSGETLTAYVKLPDSGNYEICVSTVAYRRVTVNSTSLPQSDNFRRVRDAQPIWFKAYNGNSGCSTLATSAILPSGCAPRTTAYAVSAVSHDVTWEMADKTSATWGAMKFTGSSNLDLDAATAWDHSATREYATTAGGDMFRIVHEDHFRANPQTDFGSLYQDSKYGKRHTTKVVTSEASSSTSYAEATYNKIVVTNSAPTSNQLNTDGAQKVTQYKLAVPGVGTQSNVNSGSGCFWGGEDNYGTTDQLLGNPGTQCCTVSNGECTTANFCRLKESGHDGPNANADLGGDPRTPYSPHLADGASTNAWGYIRVPSSGSYRVCYRRAGGNWRVITMTGSSTNNATLVPTPKNAGYEYHLNDTRAETFAAFGVRSLDSSANPLTLEASTFWGSATIAGSMFKIVRAYESCHLATAQSHGYSANPGSLTSRSDDSATTQEWVYFYAKVPKANTPAANNKYRICFRKGEDNWHSLRDNMYTPVFDNGAAISSAEEFYPLPKPVITYTLTDSSAGSLAQIKFARSATHQFNARGFDLSGTKQLGDLVRLVKNVTGSVEHFCDEEPAAALRDYNLGVNCDSSTTGNCATAVKNPSDGLVTNALYPYTTTSPLADDYVVADGDSSLAFIQLPAFVAGAGYKVCYKQHYGANWIETVGNGIGSILTVTTETTVSLGGSTSFQAGEYGYVELNSASGSVSGIYWDADLVKLVPVADASKQATCDGAAAGSTMFTNEQYNTLANFPSGPFYATMVESNNVSQTQNSISQTVWQPATVARAYMIFPVISGATAESTTSYSVCYMRRVTSSETSKNWINVGTVNVKHQGIVFAAAQAPQKYGYLTVNVISGGAVRLNTNNGMDRAKIVNALAPCTIAQSEFTSDMWVINPSATQWTTQSDHVGVHPVSATGISDLGPGNEVGNKAQFSVLMPNSASNFKVCYKPYGLPWIQLAQTETYADRGYNLTSSTFSLATQLVWSYTFAGSTLPVDGAASNGKVVGGSTTSGTSDFYASLSATDSSVTTTVKFVKTQFKTPSGFASIAGRTCLSEGHSVSLVATTATVSPSFNMPTEAGKYLVCVGRSGVWHFGYNANANPELEVIDNELRHAQTSSFIKVTDYYGNTTHSFASLHGDDTVYIVRANETCGADTPAFVAAATAESKLNATGNGASTSNASLYVAVRTSSDDGQNAVVIPSTAGLYKVCVKKSQAASSYTDSVKPQLLSAVYYQVAAADGNPYFAVDGAKKFVLSGCSGTTTVAEGQTIDIAVTQIDDNNVTWVSGGTSSAPTYANLATVTPATSDFKVVNFGGECRPENAVKFGFGAQNLEQYLFGGSTNFRVAFESDCPSGTCAIKFASAGVSADSDTCTFTVTNVAADNVEIVSAPTGCRVGQPCTFRVAALNANGVAYSATDAVALTFGNTASLINVGGATSANFANGYADFTVTFSANAPATGGIVSGVSVTATAFNKTSAKSLNVYSPTLSEVHIVDIFPVDVASIGVHPLTPTWEPSTLSFQGGDASGANSGNPGSSQVSAAAGFHLIAKQFYTVVVRAVGTWADTNTKTYLTSTKSFDANGNQITIVEPDTTNVPITATGCTSAGCNNAFSNEQFNAVKKQVTFRLPNNKGCQRADNSNTGCNIVFKFGGNDIGGVTQITTPVRVVAQKMVTECILNDGTATFGSSVPPATPSVCSGTSPIHQGWNLKVTATDLSGVYVDEFFDGSAAAARAVFAKGPDGHDNGMGAKLTSVAMLGAGWTNASTAQFSVGQALFTGLTVSRPCAAGQCGIQIVSNWGGNIVDAGELVTKSDTQKLQCTLSRSPLMGCSVSGGVCTPTLSATTGDSYLIYDDTQMCVTVQAVDANGNPTLYDSNWIHYYATDSSTTAPVALTITDSAQQTTIVKRYKPMKFGKAQFCFSVGTGQTAQTNAIDFTMTFVAQRFNNDGTSYWGNSMTSGRCNVDTKDTAGTEAYPKLTLWPKKLVAGAKISGFSGEGTISNSGSAGVYAATNGGTAAVSNDVTMQFVDHYGNAVTPTNVDDTHKGYQITPVLSGTDVAVTELGATAYSGLLNVTVDAAKTTSYVANSTVMYGLNLYQYCLGCRVSFLVVDPATSTTTAITTVQVAGSTVSTSVTATYYVVNTATDATRKLAFYPGTSPLTSDYWSNGTAALDATTAYPAKLFDACTATSCKPNIENFLVPKSTTIDGPGAGNLRLHVLIADATASLNSAFEASATDLASAKFQADIMNSFTVAVSIGSVPLTCTTACTDDGTSSVKRTIAAFGADLKTAVTAYMGVNTPYTADYKLQGAAYSSYTAIAWNTTGSTIVADALPSQSGSFAASATDVAGAVSVTGFSVSGRTFIWQPLREPRSLAVASVAVDTDSAAPVLEFKTHTTSLGGSNFPAALAGATAVAHAYATEWPAGVAFPITVSLMDGQYPTQALAAYSGPEATVTIDSWNGCNNGGTLTVSGTTMKNGRITATVSFSAPCENCVLKFELTNGITGTEFTEMRANPASLSVRTQPLNIVAAKPSENEHVVVTASTPDVLSAAVSLTVADTVELTLEGRATTASTSNSKITWATSNGYKASVRNRVVSTSSTLSGWWYGNGGVLRSPGATTFHSHALATTSGAALTFSFTRTCSSCMVYLDYRFDGRDFGASVSLPQLFTVTSAQSSTTLVGFVPAQVKKNTDIAVALWHTGTDGGVVAGVATSGTVSVAKTASATATDKTNGDGGLLQQTSWMFAMSEVHRLRFSRSSNLMTVSLGGNNFPVTVTTTATHLRPIFSSQTANVITAAIGGTKTFNLRAVDDLGFQDVTVGANSCNFGGIPFYCPASTATAAVSSSMTFDGTGAGFPSSDVAMTFALSDQVLTSATMAHGSAAVDVTFPSPVRDAVPVFFAGSVSSQLTSVRPAFQVPHVTVSNGLNNLELVALEVGDKTKVSTAGPFYVDVALVNALTGDTNVNNRYVAVDASHTITMTTTGCPTMSIDTQTSFNLVKGYKRVPIQFTGDGSTGTCAITFSAGCTSCTSTIQSIVIKKVTAASFQYLRPTMLDNNGAVAGPMYGVAGRRTFVSVQLYGLDANSNAVAVGSSACPNGCFLKVSNPGSTDANCGFTPNKASEAFDVNGTATIELKWNDVSVSSYKCSVKVEVGTDSAFSTTLTAPDSTNAHVSEVTVCRPVRVELNTNTSTAYRGMFLKTGVPYMFEAQTVDATGARCLGDSQDDATQLVVEAVKNDGTVGAASTVSGQIFVTNVNRTATDTASVAMGQQSVDVARATVTAVAGGFGFAVVFDNSTVALGLTGVRVRITASSVVPDISGANKYAISGPVETVIAASTLRFAPMYKVPKHVVTQRTVVTVPNSTTTDIVVQAVDALNPMWDAVNLADAPNVARGAMEFGNDLPVFWQQAPAPADGVIRASFQTGALTGKLVQGEAMWSGLSWTGADGMYALAVAPATANSPVKATKPIMFMAQKPVALQLRVENFTASTQKTCTGNCVLMNTTFTETINTTYSASKFLMTKSLQPFNLDVQVGDAASKAVLGDDESVVQVEVVNQHASAPLVFGRPPEFREKGIVFARVRNGVARFNLGFVGTTEYDAASGNHSLIQLKFSCPATRPIHLLKPYETPANPCALSSFSTMNILVGDMRARTFFDTPVETRKSIKVEFAASSVLDINTTKLVHDMAFYLNGNGFPWLNPGRAPVYIGVQACGVTSFFDVAKHDLGNSVCTSGKCQLGGDLATCPPQVTGCKCAHIAARGVALSRYLLQTNSSGNTSTVVAEFNFNLGKVEGFPGSTTAELSAAYTGLQDGAVAFLETPTVKSEFGITRAQISTLTVQPDGSVPVPDGGLATLAPTPIPTQPPAPPSTPTPPSPPTGTTPPAAGASAVSMLASVLLAVVLAMLA